MQTQKLANNLNSLAELSTLSQLQDVNTDLILSLCGKKIGSGVYRTVYDYNLDDRYVIKLEPNNTDANIAEFILWDEIRGLSGDLKWVKDWFAPVLWISPNNKVLIMQKTEEKPNKERPKKVPAFFTDLKRDNWGWLGNRFVCHDYGFLYKFIKYEKKFTTINKDAWW